ncbi:MAG: endonuclease III [Nitrospirota bacterium]|nr:endonuclease III [Nitrospirota bacterium]MDE3242378.1 endonuclease III [Nitrospirota bacterium]
MTTTASRRGRKGARPVRRPAPVGSGGPTPEAKRRTARILRQLEESTPEARVELSHRNPLELLIATILSAQCTDQRVNQVTPQLFARYRRAEDYAQADRTELESLIRPTGFFKSKARNIMACAQALVGRFQGKVPAGMEELTSLSGVGRKTANVILGACFGQPAVVVDTHVKRVANRLRLASTEDPEKIESALQQLIPPHRWTQGSQRLLLHGRYVCLARAPRCEHCPLYRLCDWPGKAPR